MKYGKCLSVLFVGILCIIPLFVDECSDNLYYSMPAAFFSSLFIFISFPGLANYFFKRSVTYDDLIIKYGKGDPERLQKLFTVINIGYSSCLVAFILFYVVQKYRISEVIRELDITHGGFSTQAIDTIGIVAGLIGFFRKWQIICGKLLMKILFRCKGKAKQLDTTSTVEITDESDNSM